MPREPWLSTEPVDVPEPDPDDPTLLVNILKPQPGDPELKDWFLDHGLTDRDDD